ncbi:transposon Tf2-8 polyprotein [Trichonephila clavipes]|nr:transposon Tf2-8 polyprotein [Trichonephila clavipes]
MARRGKCAKLFSDNGKNFVGASNEIKKLLEIVRKPDEKLANYLAAEGIEWKFIPARSPNFGGLWEAAVKSYGILVASKDEAQHISHTKQVFQRFQDAGLVIKVVKCRFLQTEVYFLSHHISVNSIEPSKKGIKVIEDFKLPETVKELRRYLGVINFYHRFIPKAAENKAVLNNYLKRKKSNDKNKIHWTEESVQAFENSKRQLCKATVLVHPSENPRISLMVDASDNGIGAMLQQLEHGVRKPFSFFSRKLTDAPKR